MQYLTTNSLLVLCSSTVKEPVPLQVECTKQSFHYTRICCWGQGIRKHTNGVQDAGYDVASCVACMMA